MNEVNALALKLAGWKVPCPAEYHHLTTEGNPCCLAPETRQPLPDCGGTGRVYLFGDAVRIRCNRCWRGSVRHSSGLGHDLCPNCEGALWIPSLDMEVWLNALHPAGFWAVIGAGLSNEGRGCVAVGALGMRSEEVGGHGLEALLRAIRQVLETQYGLPDKDQATV